MDELAVPKGLEPPTHRLGNDCSILLSYGTARLLLSGRGAIWGGGCRRFLPDPNLARSPPRGGV